MPKCLARFLISVRLTCQASSQLSMARSPSAWRVTLILKGRRGLALVALGISMHSEDTRSRWGTLWAKVRNEQWGRFFFSCKGKSWSASLVECRGVMGGYCCLVAQSCPALCDPMGCSTGGFPKGEARTLTLTLPAQCPKGSDSLSIRAAVSIYPDTPGVTCPE